MADDTEVGQGAFSPELRNFYSSFSTEEGQDWAAKAAAMVQAHADATQAADEAQDVHNQLVNNVSAVKQNLIGMAQQDPSAADLALDLAPHLIGGIAQHAGLDAEHGAIGDLSDHIQGQIAHAAIQTLAGMDEGAARNALAGRLGSALPEGDASALDTYISSMASIRQTDHEAAGIQMTRDAINSSHRLTSDWLAGLMHPETGDQQFPQGWGQQMLADQRLTLNDKSALWGAYQRVAAGQDLQTSDPSALTQMLARVASANNRPGQEEILSHVGKDLTLSDAHWLGTLSGPQSPSQRQAVQNIADHLDAARQQIGNRSAFSRFVDWFVPAVKNGASLDPNAPGYAMTPERMARFQPTGDDIVQPAQLSAGSPRPPLSGIFGAFVGAAQAGLQDYNKMMSGKILNEPFGAWRTLAAIGGAGMSGTTATSFERGLLSNGVRDGAEAILSAFEQGSISRPEALGHIFELLGGKAADIGSTPGHVLGSPAARAARSADDETLRDTKTGKPYNPATDA